MKKRAPAAIDANDSICSTYLSSNYQELRQKVLLIGLRGGNFRRYERISPVAGLIVPRTYLQRAGRTDEPRPATDFGWQR